MKVAGMYTLALRRLARHVEVHRIVHDAAALSQLIELDAAHLYALNPWRKMVCPPKK